MEKRYVVGLGEALWDVLPEGKKLGGAPANFAYHAGLFLGQDQAIAISALGEDALADETEAALRSHGLQFIMPRVPFPTGTVQVTLTPQGVPSYEIKEGVAWDNIPFTPEIEEVARHCRAVCFGTLAQRNYVSRETIRRFLDATPDDCLKIYDINLRQSFYTPELIQSSLMRCDILKLNDEELAILAKLFGFEALDVEDQCWLLLGKFDLKRVILTCGTQGSYVYSEGRSAYVETPGVEVADTVGAGDSFTAAFAAATLCGLSSIKAHKFAVDVSAYVCTQHGAMPPMPEDLIDRVKVK